MNDVWFVGEADDRVVSSSHAYPLAGGTWSPKTSLAAVLFWIEARGALGKPSPNIAADHFLSAVEDAHRVPMSNLMAVLVLAGWSPVALQAGTAWLIAAER